MKVVEIFESIEGEGRRAGALATFVRFWGCNLACSYCDSRYAWEGQPGPEVVDLTIPEIIDAIERKGNHNVTVTGGEPLIYPEMKDLLLALAEEGYYVNVETNGTILPPVTHANIFYTADFKCWSSGMCDKMNLDVIDALTEWDVLKFVVGSDDDLEQTFAIIDGRKPAAQIYISPVFGEIKPKRIVEFMLERKEVMSRCKLQLQIHKYVWPANKRGV